MTIRKQLISRIFLDHRIRRLRLLFRYLRFMLLELNKSRLCMLLGQQLSDLQGSEDTEACAELSARLSELAAQNRDRVLTSCDLPEVGPNSLYDSASTGSISNLTVQLPLSAQTGRSVVSKIVNRFAAMLADISQTLSLHHAIQHELLAEFEHTAERLNDMVDAWQSCIADPDRISTLLVSNARVVFSTVTCAGRSSIMQSESLLDRIKSKSMDRRVRIDPAVK